MSLTVGMNNVLSRQNVQSSKVGFKGNVQSEMSESELRNYYKEVDKIAKYILNEFTPFQGNNAGMIETGMDSIPANGAIGLRMYYGAPMYMMTPLGQLSIRGSGYNPEIKPEKMKQLKETLGLVEIKPQKHDEMGTHGPIYAITKDLNGKPLPQLNPDGISQMFGANRVNDSQAEENAALYDRVKPETSWYRASSSRAFEF